jgi:hypothetical protein
MVSKFFKFEFLVFIWSCRSLKKRKNMSRPVKGHQAQTGLQPLSIPLCLVAPPLVAQNVTLLARVAFRGALQPSAPPTVV